MDVRIPLQALVDHTPQGTPITVPVDWIRAILSADPNSRSSEDSTHLEGLLLTADEVADVLKVHRKWVYRHADELDAVRLSRKIIRFPREALERYIRRRKAASTRR